MSDRSVATDMIALVDLMQIQWIKSVMNWSSHSGFLVLPQLTV